MRRLCTNLLSALTLVLAAMTAQAAPPPLFAAKADAFAPGPAHKVVGVYVPGWESTRYVDALRDGSVTHLIYAFLHPCGPGQRPMDAEGCKGKADFDFAAAPPNAESAADFDAAFARLKKRMPAVQVLASVGGWAGSDPFFYLAGDAARRATFVAACQRFLREHPSFDGIDIDWEHPGGNGAAIGVQLGSPRDGHDFADLMIDLRAGLDALAKETGRRYLLTVAVDAGPAVVKRVEYARAAPALDLVFAMSYDYYGPWTQVAGDHSALAPSKPDGQDGLMAGVRNLEEAGVPAAKIVGGVAMYGRGFAHVAEPKPGVAYQGPFPPDGKEPGAVPYKDIATRWLGPRGSGLNGFKLRFDAKTRAYSLWNAKTNEWLGYDDPRAILSKGRYALDHGLAGLFAWELSQDNGDLLDAMNLGVGNQALK